MVESANRPAQIVAIGQHDTIKDAAEKMSSHNVGCLIVNDDNGHFIGLVTERDISRYVAACPDQIGRIGISEIMTDRVVTCTAGTPTSVVREIMTTHRIRHLPILEGGMVVGILSARDVIGQQLLEDRAAAEEVAMLSNCLKSIELSEALETVAAEAPKLFEAKNCVLCLYRDEHWDEGPELVSSNRCPCLVGHLHGIEGIENLPGEGGHFEKTIPAECEKCGGQSPRLIIPLTITGLIEPGISGEKKRSGYLCMCGLASSIASNRELMAYKAKLTREIITAHLSNATRYQQARLTSLTDALTGVGSRKLLEEKLQAECDRAARYKRPFSVAIVDLDHFKMLNDTLGHAAGDDAIRKMALCMNKERRIPDVLARYGGDEFVILMPETKAADGRVLMERIRSKILQLRLSQGMSLTISCGIAESDLERNDPREVMRRADMALYDAKNAGRNCIKLWDPSMARVLAANEIELEKVKTLQRRLAGLSEKAEKMFMESIWGLVKALEAKDTYAKNHSVNVMHYAVHIAKTMDLGPKHVDLIRRAAMIHDIGKIGIPDAILAKPDDLTPAERKVVEQHPVIAVKILEKMSFLEQEVAIIRHHHEKWNGQGYPDGLARTAIPIGARVIAVADTFDALTAAHAYHASRSVAEAVHLLMDSAGYDLDPDGVAAITVWFQAVARKLGKPAERLVLSDVLGVRSLPEQTVVQAEPSRIPAGASGGKR